MVIWNAKSDSTAILATYATIAILLFLSIAGAYWAYGQTEIMKANKTQLATLEEDARRLDSILNDVQKYRSSMTQISATIPQGYEQTARFMSQLETRAKESGVAIDQSQLETSTEKIMPEVQLLKVSQKVTGPYSSVLKYTAAIAKLPFHTSIDLLEITTANGVSGVNIVIKVYIKAI
jgi:Tfp pilus assembly protein PilO